MIYLSFYGNNPIGNLNVMSGGCFTNISRALQNNLVKIHNTRNHIYGDNFKLKLCTCAQSMALGTRAKFQLEILITSTISATHKFRENILESSRNDSVAKRDKATLTCKEIEHIAWPKSSIDEALIEFELAVYYHFKWSMSNHLCRLHSPAV